MSQRIETKGPQTRCEVRCGKNVSPCFPSSSSMRASFLFSTLHKGQVFSTLPLYAGVGVVQLSEFIFHLNPSHSWLS